MATREEEIPAIRKSANLLYDDIMKIEKYLEFQCKNKTLSLSPETRQQLKRAQDKVYALRVCLHYESCRRY